MRAFPLLFALALACTGPDEKPVDTDDVPADTDTDTAVDDTAVNQPPSAAEIAITPSAPAPGAALTVTVLTPSVDPEGAAVSYRYAWSVDGAARDDLTTETVGAGATVDGETWAVTVTPTDGALDGEPSTASVVIGNQPPTAPVLRIEPTSPSPDDDLVLVFDPAASDPNGDTLTQSIRWFVNEAEAISFADATTIPAMYVDGGDVWRALVSVTDGVNAPVTAETSVTVGNTPPEIETPNITPSSPKDNNDLSVSVRADDADGDELAYTYVWYRDGVEATDVGNSDTVLAEATTVGEEWTVTVTVSDGTDDASASAAGVEIADYDGVSYTHNFTAYVTNDGGTYTTATGEWSLALLTSGSYGTNDCDLFWEIDSSADSRVCPRCEFAFSGTVTLDTALSSGSGTRCDALSGDGSLEWSLQERSLSFSGNAYPRGSGSYYRYALSLYATGSGGYAYSGSYFTFIRYYDVTTTEDTAGNVEVQVYSYFAYRF